jgi:hypothetical protein
VTSAHFLHVSIQYKNINNSNSPTKKKESLILMKKIPLVAYQIYGMTVMKGTFLHTSQWFPG